MCTRRMLEARILAGGSQGEFWRDDAIHITVPTGAAIKCSSLLQRRLSHGNALAVVVEGNPIFLQNAANRGSSR